MSSYGKKHRLMHLYSFVPNINLKRTLLLIVYVFATTVFYGEEFEIKNNPLKVSITSPINQSVFDIIIYNNNFIVTYKATNKEIISIKTLPKGRYTITLKSGNFIKESKFIELVDSNISEGVDGVNDILYLNVSELKEEHPDLFRSSPNFPPLLHHYNYGNFSETDVTINGVNHKLLALPAVKKLWAKYNILVDDSLIKWNEIQIIRFMTVLSTYNDFLSNNTNLPISIWKLTTGNDFLLNEEEGIYSLSLPVKYFVETVHQVNRLDLKPFLNKLDDSVFEFVKTIFSLPDHRNFLYKIDYYSTMNDNFIFNFKNAFKEDAKKYFVEFSNIETDLISNTLNYIGFKTRLLKNISYCAKANNLTSLRFDSDDSDEIKFIEQCMIFHADDFVDSSHHYKDIMVAFLDQYFDKVLTDDIYTKWLSILNWSYDINANKWTNNGRLKQEYYGIYCDSPKNEFTANIIHFLYNNEFSPTCRDNTKELLRRILFDSDVTSLSYDSHIKNSSIHISGEEEQNKIINIELEAKLIEQGSTLKKIDLLIKNNFGFFEIMTLTPQQEDIFPEVDFVKLNSTIEINKNTRSALYYIDGINFNYGDGVSNNFHSVDCELVFPVNNISQDLSPPEMMTETLKFTLTPLGEQGTELEVSFNVKDNYSMSSDLNSFIYIKSPEINNFYIEMLGYGIDSGSSGYFTETGQCILRTILPSYYPSGEYTIINIELHDKANNISRYTPNDPAFDPPIFSFNLSNINPDVAAPVIDKDNIIIKLHSTTDNSPDESNQFPVIFMNLKDDHSGVGEAIFKIIDSDQDEYSIYSLPEDLFLEMLSAEEQEIYNTAFPVYHKFGNIEGGLILSSLKVKDKAHNPNTLEMINLTFDFSTTQNTEINSNTELKWKVIENDFGIYFRTSTAYNYKIERSFDLANWVTIQEIVGNDANYYFIDDLDKTERLMFYRTKSFKKN